MAAVMTPIRVVARLRSAPALPPRWPVPLDSLLAWAATPRGHGFGIGGTIDPAVTDAVELPLRRITHETVPEEWWWAASCGRAVDPADPAVVWKHSRNSTGTMERRVPADHELTVDETRAGWKSIRLPVLVTPTLAMEWTAEGDPQKVAALLEKVTHVGKDRGQGQGQVIAWEVHSAESFSLYDEGGPVRPIFGAGDFGGMRPPYWHPGQARPIEAREPHTWTT